MKWRPNATKSASPFSIIASAALVKNAGQEDEASKALTHAARRALG